MVNIRCVPHTCFTYVHGRHHSLTAVSDSYKRDGDSEYRTVTPHNFLSQTQWLYLPKGWWPETLISEPYGISFRNTYMSHLFLLSSRTVPYRPATWEMCRCLNPDIVPNTWLFPWKPGVHISPGSAHFDLSSPWILSCPLPLPWYKGCL